MTSINISSFLDFIKDSETIYKIAVEKVSECDKATQDILHKIELNDKTCKQRSKSATQLRFIRQDRRYYKNIVEELEPLVRHVQDERNKKAFDTMKNVLGAVRKQEGYHNTRSYKPRVIMMED